MEFLQQLSGSYMDSLLQEIYVKKKIETALAISPVWNSVVILNCPNNHMIS